MLLHEFDAEKNAILNPTTLFRPLPDFPEVIVSCFAWHTFERMVINTKATPFYETSIANMTIRLYKATIQGVTIGFVNAYVGAAGCVGVFEDLVALGMKRLVLFGTCGILDETIQPLSLIIPTSSLRDEGTSYHYAPASDVIATNEHTRSIMEDTFQDLHIPYVTGRAWTTDAIYRETYEKVRLRKEQGAICVDMECSAIAAWAKFRNINVCHFFYSADSLVGEKWVPGALKNTSFLQEKDQIASIAITVALNWIKKFN